MYRKRTVANTTTFYFLAKLNWCNQFLLGINVAESYARVSSMHFSPISPEITSHFCYASHVYQVLGEKKNFAPKVEHSD